MILREHTKHAYIKLGAQYPLKRESLVKIEVYFCAVSVEELFFY